MWVLMNSGMLMNMNLTLFNTNTYPLPTWQFNGKHATFLWSLISINFQHGSRFYCAECFFLWKAYLTKWILDHCCPHWNSDIYCCLSPPPRSLVYKVGFQIVTCRLRRPVEDKMLKVEKNNENRNLNMCFVFFSGQVIVIVKFYRRVR